ncbi:jerky protein homolog-like [Trichonephila clavipes]|nr:jerky protein homolog-like [Trichonephila clavipes]
MASNSKRKRNVLRIETMLEILNRLSKGETGASLAQFYNVEKLAISKIKKPRNPFKSRVKTCLRRWPEEKEDHKGSKRCSSDRALYLWFSQRRSKGDPISDPLLCEKALELNKKLGGSADFKASALSVWLNSALFSKWYSKDFIPNVKEPREREGKTDKVLLILDNAPCHPPVKILNAIDDDFHGMFLSSNITALVQPMDQSVIEKLKRIYRKQVLRILLLAENDEESIAAFAEKLNMKEACYILAEAWDSLERQNLKCVWNKLWLALEAEEKLQ